MADIARLGRPPHCHSSQRINPQPLKYWRGPAAMRKSLDVSRPGSLGVNSYKADAGCRYGGSDSRYQGSRKQRSATPELCGTLLPLCYSEVSAEERHYSNQTCPRLQPGQDCPLDRPPLGALLIIKRCPSTSRCSACNGVQVASRNLAQFV